MAARGAIFVYADFNKINKYLLFIFRAPVNKGKKTDATTGI
jgi:hypothetical protein